MSTLRRSWREFLLALGFSALLVGVAIRPGANAQGALWGSRANEAAIISLGNLVTHINAIGSTLGGFPEQFHPIQAELRRRNLERASLHWRYVASHPIETLAREGAFGGAPFRDAPGQRAQLVAHVAQREPLEPGEFLFIPVAKDRYGDRRSFLLLCRRLPEGGGPLLFLQDRFGLRPRYPEGVQGEIFGEYELLAPSWPLPPAQVLSARGPNGERVEVTQRGMSFTIQSMGHPSLVPVPLP